MISAKAVGTDEWQNLPTFLSGPAEQLGSQQRFLALRPPANDRWRENYEINIELDGKPFVENVFIGRDGDSPLLRAQVNAVGNPTAVVQCDDSSSRSSSKCDKMISTPPGLESVLRPGLYTLSSPTAITMVRLRPTPQPEVYSDDHAPRTISGWQKMKIEKELASMKGSNLVIKTVSDEEALSFGTQLRQSFTEAGLEVPPIVSLAKSSATDAELYARCDAQFHSPLAIRLLTLMGDTGLSRRKGYTCVGNLAPNSVVLVIGFKEPKAVDPNLELQSGMY